jgi:hypothetical protein
MLTSSSYKSVSLNGPPSRSYGYDPNDPPRIITYTKQAQGWSWNDEVFLPGYLLGRRRRERERERLRERERESLRRRRKEAAAGSGMQDGWGEESSEEDSWGRAGGERSESEFDENEDDVGVVEVFVTDEEVRAMMP